MEVAVKDPATDGILAILAPTGLSDPTAVAEELKRFAKVSDKPIIASWMGGDGVAPGVQILSQAGIPTYGYPDSAARVFQLMWSYSANLKALYETPEDFESDDPGGVDQASARKAATAWIDAIRAKGRTLLTEAESKDLLRAYGIPTVRTEIAASAEQAAGAAGRVGYPVVLKLHSETVTHKTDVGGVQLNLADEAAVRGAFQRIKDSVTRKAGAEHFLGVTVQPMIRAEGYELILGSSVDSQFGPVLLFGSGGQLVEVYKDRAIGLPPLNTTLARLLMERTKIYTALRGVRGRKPVDLAELQRLLVRFSYLVMEQKWIKEIDINPLMASGDGLLALDARVVLHGADVLSPPKSAIRPYPVRYVKTWRFDDDGTEVTIRPIRPEDENLIVDFHAKLSERTVQQRFAEPMPFDERVAHDRLVRVCFGDYDREIALVAERWDPVAQAVEIIAVGRLSKAHLLNEASLTMLAMDEYQGRGLGTEISRRLLEIARSEKLDRVSVEIPGENPQMVEVCRGLGFEMEAVRDGVVRGVLGL